MAQFKVKLAQLMREKSARDQQAITQQHIADATGIAYPTINRWYQGADIGRIDAAVIAPLMTYFGCEIGDLIEVVR